MRFENRLTAEGMQKFGIISFFSCLLCFQMKDHCTDITIPQEFGNNNNNNLPKLFQLIDDVIQMVVMVNTHKYTPHK